jgi:hypothetical protein
MKQNLAENRPYLFPEKSDIVFVARKSTGKKSWPGDRIITSFAPCSLLDALAPVVFPQAIL